MTKVKKPTDIKAFNVRLPRETWVFLKQVAAKQDRSMMDIIVTCVEKYKIRLKNRLTDDTDVL